MADTFLTLKQLNNLFWAATTTTLSYETPLYLSAALLQTDFWKSILPLLGFDLTQYTDPDNPPKFISDHSPVRNAWPTQGAPSWEPPDDIVFIKVGEQEDEINKLIDTVLSSIHNDSDNVAQTQAQTRVINVSWVFYGPNSFDNAFKVRRSLVQPVFHDVLFKNQMSLIPRVPAPRRVPENYNGQWWERIDFQASFNEKVKFETTIPCLKSINVAIITEKGDEIDVNTQLE